MARAPRPLGEVEGGFGSHFNSGFLDRRDRGVVDGYVVWVEVGVIFP